MQIETKVERREERRETQRLGITKKIKGITDAKAS